MTLLEKLGALLSGRYYLGVDVGCKEHVAGVISLHTLVRGDERWKRAGLRAPQAYMDHFSTEPAGFLEL